MMAILDYGLGNIKAFANIYGRAKIPYIIAKTPEDLSEASRIILPGVGSYDQAIHLFETSGLKEPVLELVVNQGMPLLGICIGMHIMGNSSEEGKREGLGLIPGRVKLLPSATLPRPHMGWNQVNFLDKKDQTFLKELPKEVEFYFLHSYFFEAEEDYIVGRFNYGENLPCVINKGNIFGIQFHPEKSHEYGEKILLSFAGDWKC